MYQAISSLKLETVLLNFDSIWQEFWNSNGAQLMYLIILPIILVFIIEILVDWLKHSFIIKFNGINPNVYAVFAQSLYRDLLGVANKKSKQTPATHNNSPNVAKRIGLVVLPLACLVIRVTLQTLESINKMHQENIETTSNQDEDAIGTWKVPLVLVQWLQKPPSDSQQSSHTIAPIWLVLLFLMS
jgi:hypothetical protein